MRTSRKVTVAQRRDRAAVKVDLWIPERTYDIIMEAAALAGRSFDQEMLYITEVFCRYHPPDFEDCRTAEEWEELFLTMRYEWTTPLPVGEDLRHEYRA